MPNQESDYLNLVTSQHRTKPKFIAMIKASVDAELYFQGLLDQMESGPLFDLDYAVGDQLDIIGQWVGVSRNISVPIANVFFTWDDPTGALGWDFGSWQPSLAPSSVTSLPDDAYRTLLRAKIAASHWDGTTEGAYAIWQTIFGGSFFILIQDYGNMTFALIITGGIVDALTLALITGGYLDLRPETVRITEYFVSTSSNPLFAWDIDAPNMQGWDTGWWAKEVTPT